MVIRRIETKDSQRFLDMLKQLDNETNDMMFEQGERKTTIEEMQSDIIKMNETKSLILIVEDNKKIVGFLSAERGFANRIKHSAYIVIGLLKEYRGKRMGVKLFAKMEEWALESDIKRLELTVMVDNESAIHLYKKMGFKIEGIKEKSLIVNGKYVDEYYMSKIL
ncbi:N-acetyltransferase [Vallitalea longa]|uniref:N-acetyltransferase n=1 Tax=Vallitalea longa TaxID=2936439 RepID=A0A9W5YAK3_9FIRM|nr:GNAT family N-acetyltransferase [Vallitalea longa]GKX28853.1 N-acetyltransferase [Vallitalea longa]